MKENFLWGAATSSHQVEGGNRYNDWWHWEEQGKIEGGVRSGLAIDHWNRFEEDLDLAKELGLNAYRFSIEWSRVEPEPGKWEFAALDRYSELVAACETRGLLPMATLHHFTLPLWLSERGGFTHDDSPEYFSRFVKRVANRIGARVPLWCTLNEPMTLAVGQYLGGFMPPADFKPRLVSQVTRQLLRSHVKAYGILHGLIRERSGPFKSVPLQVGIAHNMMDFHPARQWNPVERALTGVFRRFYNRSWLDAVTGNAQHFGVRGLIPYADVVPEALRHRSVDFIGINYYTKCLVHWGAWRSRSEEGVLYGDAGLLALGVTFARPGEPTSEMGWSFHPAGLGRMIRFVRRYGVPIYITENGIADKRDRFRQQFLSEHLREIALQVRHGADVRGYFHWSLLDNFEWIKGFTPCFGLVEVDYETFQRTPRPSARYFEKVARAHRARESTSPDLDLLDTLTV